MSRASISTGGIDFPLREGEEQSTPTKTKGDPSLPMHVAILANFSGNHERSALQDRKVIEVNLDNFDEVFASMNVTLKLPVSEQPISFRELDDLDPDFIYQRVSFFNQLRMLKGKLNKSETFEEAAREISQWQNYREASKQTPSDSEESIPLPDNLLDAVLSGQSTQRLLDNSPAGHINQLIKDIVSPFVTTKADPRREDMLNAVEEATSDLMRKIMHHSEFQDLESSWRALYLLIRRLETSANLKFFIIDANKTELGTDLLSMDEEQEKSLEDSQLFKLLVERQRTAGGVPFSLIVSDYRLEDNDHDIGLAAIMASIGQTINATWVSGAHERLAGCKSLFQQPDASDWDHTLDEYVASDWKLVCSSEDAQYLALTAPRFLLRLPYGKKTSSLEYIQFEELPAENNHEYYLWGNSAFLVAMSLAKSFLANGWNFRPGQINHVDDLPLHVYDDDGESEIKPCAEILLTDRAADRMEEAGLMPIRSVKQKESVVISAFRSASSNSSIIRGNWTS